MSSILLAGDSLAVGLTGPLGALAKAAGVELKGDGRTGTTAAEWVKGGWLAQDIAGSSPDLVLISLGTNDATGDLSGFAGNLKTLVDQATSRGATVGWIGPPYLSAELHQFPAGNVDRMRQVLLDTLTPRGINIFPSDAGGAEKDYARAADKLHMTPAGYAAWAKDIADWATFKGPEQPPARAMQPSPGMSKGKKWAIGLTTVVVAGGALYAWKEWT